jgi:uncharacterized membrane protein YbhN (UPF0104 family)
VSHTADRPHPLRTALTWFLRIGVSGVLLYVLLTRMVDVHRVWELARGASLGWLLVAMAFYILSLVVGAWRWGLLLHAQRVPIPLWTLVRSYMVAFYFNNFLPSNIGGDVVRIGDTAQASGSKTRATTVVMIDRILGLLGVFFVAALGATVEPRVAGFPGSAALWGIFALAAAVVAPMLLAPERVRGLLRPLRVIHQEWVEERLERFISSLAKFTETPQALAGGFAGAITVQVLLVGFYAAIAQSLRIPISTFHLAVLIPMSFVVQIIPLSINGFGIREGTFGYYFNLIGLPKEGGVVLSLIGAALMMLFSVSGAIVYLARKRH